MKKFLKYLAKALVILVVVAIVARIVMVMSGDSDDVVIKDSIAVVRLEGVILDTRELDKKLKKLDENDKIKGVILEINSPGGIISPTQVIYLRIMKMKKPVYAVMESIAASGGYYIAVAADKIYALDSTTTGSIGVIMQYSNVEALFEKIGIKSVVFKSGKMKDVPSTTRDLDKDEMSYMQDSINEFYDQFLRDVLKRRNISEAKLRKLADGRVFSGRKALENKLIDRIGTREEAIVDMKDEIGIQALEIKEFYDKDENIIQQFMSKASSLTEAYVPNGGFYYLYKPGL
ncbi:MAG: signal peptide peptidase SppA [Denitrovibrio sp.]|nr:MAG: signal peptide peptidase SppA [Denitrovibrio sp.]